jgi:hypothetical protein
LERLSNSELEEREAGPGWDNGHAVMAPASVGYLAGRPQIESELQANPATVEWLLTLANAGPGGLEATPASLRRPLWPFGRALSDREHTVRALLAAGIPARPSWSATIPRRPSAQPAQPESPVLSRLAVEAASVEAPVVEMPAVEMPAVEMPAVETPAVEIPEVEIETIPLSLQSGGESEPRRGTEVDDAHLGERQLEDTGELEAVDLEAPEQAEGQGLSLLARIGAYGHRPGR